MGLFPVIKYGRFSTARRLPLSCEASRAFLTSALSSPPFALAALALSTSAAAAVISCHLVSSRVIPQARTGAAATDATSSQQEARVGGEKVLGATVEVEHERAGVGVGVDDMRGRRRQPLHRAVLQLERLEEVALVVEGEEVRPVDEEVCHHVLVVEARRESDKLREQRVGGGRVAHPRSRVEVPVSAR
eukprot:CAMPEP_0119368482 /NCGR_PEP_ID=MMETSP1334-20130426/15123_1 /TAXON_ID=127549 /ORGANISM="Calcidiscus leptoporus, Strain RCC1130" /LENGTH=188 /DNA_ID=CAMNT_0007385127 /DNA_START=455 /DNA_END=1020 /DNA_ORIENTATION=-